MQTEIIIFQTGTIGQNKALFRDTVNGKIKECFTSGEFLAVWSQAGQFYAKRVNQCYESDRLLLKGHNNLVSITSNISNLHTLKVATDRQAIIISQDTITYSMSCDGNYNAIDHYPYKLLQIYSKNGAYISGPIDKYIFCNPKTKNKLEVLDLKRRIELLEIFIKQNNLDDTKIHRAIKNWH